MSYDIYLCDPITKETLELDEPHFMQGGTYCMNGTTELHINITYNYAKFYKRILGAEGIRLIYGQLAADTIPLLEQCVSQLADDITDNYWDPTEGNAKAALYQLLALAKMRPDGVWKGD
jgi:hypothetical protein